MKSWSCFVILILALSSVVLGQPSFRNRVQRTLSSGSNFVIYDSITLPDGNEIGERVLVGSADFGTPESPNVDAVLIRLDGEGVVKESYRLGGAGREEAFDVHAFNGHLYVAGETDSLSDPYGIFLVQLEIDTNSLTVDAAIALCGGRFQEQVATHMPGRVPGPAITSIKIGSSMRIGVVGSWARDGLQTGVAYLFTEGAVGTSSVFAMGEVSAVGHDLSLTACARAVSGYELGLVCAGTVMDGDARSPVYLRLYPADPNNGGDLEITHQYALDVRDVLGRSVSATGDALVSVNSEGDGECLLGGNALAGVPAGYLLHVDTSGPTDIVSNNQTSLAFRSLDLALTARNEQPIKIACAGGQVWRAETMDWHAHLWSVDVQGMLEITSSAFDLDIASDSVLYAVDGMAQSSGEIVPTGVGRLFNSGESHGLLVADYWTPVACSKQTVVSESAQLSVEATTSSLVVTELDGPMAIGWSLSSIELSSALCPCAVADLTSIGGSGPPDGQISVDDIISFANSFSDGCSSAGVPCAISDVGSIGGGDIPDGQLTVDDVILFYNSVAEGCLQ